MSAIPNPLRTLFFLACLLAALAHGQATAPDLARKAHITGSSSRSEYPLSNLIDGDMTTQGSTGLGHVKDQWMRLDWDAPQTMSGVVMYSTGPWTQTIEAQVDEGGSWVTVGKAGSATKKAPLVTVFTFKPTTTKSLRFLFDGGAAFYEIEVYNDPAKIEQIVKEHVLPRIVVAGDLRGHLIGTVSEDAGATGVAGAEVVVTGSGRHGDWQSTATTDANGFFTADLPFGATGRIHVEARAERAGDRYGLNSRLIAELRSSKREQRHPDRSEAERRDLTGFDPSSALNPIARTGFPSDPSTSLGTTETAQNDGSSVGSELASESKVVAEADFDASDISTVLTPRPLSDRLSLDGVWEWAAIPPTEVQPGARASSRASAEASLSVRGLTALAIPPTPIPGESATDRNTPEPAGSASLTPAGVTEGSPGSQTPGKANTTHPTLEGSQSIGDLVWSKVRVPAHWEVEGLTADSGKALYRRTFTVPAAWTGKRVKLRADAVYSKCQVWINGTRVGGHDGGATPFELDITDAARPGTANEIVVQVDARSIASDLDNASYFAYYELAGIWQHIELFAVDPVHVSHLGVRTTFDKAYKNAELALEVDLVNEGKSGRTAHDISFRLTDPKGRGVAIHLEKRLQVGDWARVPCTCKATIERPEPWNAEAPRLYKLVGYVDGRKVLEQPIGFRQIEIKDRAVTLNGTPLKIRGISKLDCHPLMGRALTPEIDKLDAEMIKSANFNAVRATIFPPHPVALDAADEKGLYYENEGPTCWGNHANDLRYVPVYAGVMCEYLERDRNHPCVVDWSICNESDYGRVFSIAQKLMKSIDPTRLYSATWGDDTLDVDTMHHPVNLQRIKESLSWPKPAYFDEVLGLFHGWEDLALWLDLDPGMKDYWVEGISDILHAINAGHNQLGTIQFCWSDDTVLVPGKGVDIWRHEQPPIRYTESIYKMPKRGMVGDVEWGTVDGWRRPRPEYWLSKKLYSPVQIIERPLTAPTSGPVIVPVENFNQFVDLNRYVCKWTLGSEKGESHAECRPMSKGSLAIPVSKPIRPDDVLNLEFYDETGRLVDAYKLTFKPHDMPVLPSSGRPARIGGPSAYLDGATPIRLLGKDCELAYDQLSGEMLRCLKNREVVLNAGPTLRLLKTTAPTEIYPTGFALAKGVHAADDPTAWKLASATTRTEGSHAVLEWKGSYGKDLVGGYEIRMDDAGDVEIRYEFKYNGAPISVREIALEFALPLTCDRLEWDRRAEYSVYPPDHIGRPRGTAVPHPAVPQAVPPGNRPFGLDDHPWGCNDFRSTKRNIYWASLTNAAGEGVKVISNGKQHIRATVGVHDILLKVMDWYGGEGSTYDWGFHYGDGKHIATGDVLKGTVRLQLLGGRNGG